MDHPREDLIAFLTGELDEAARARVDAHLAACAACRAEADGFGAMLAGLRASVPAPPPVDWGRYGAELRARLQARQRWSGLRRWWTSPVPLALSATLAGVLLALTWLGQEPQPPRPDLRAFEEAALGQRVGLLSEWPVVERLDLLENLDVITQLDHLDGGGEG